MALTPIALPQDVLDYIRTVFTVADDRLAAKLENIPTLHEEFLDLSLIEALSDYAVPHRTKSDTVVDIDIHFVGGG